VASVADLPTPREHLGMATDGTYAYVVGGRDLSSDKKQRHRALHPKADPWTALAPCHTPRRDRGRGGRRASGRGGWRGPTTVDATVFA
jgi:non-specific serine/threonine protein kinase